MSDPQDYDEDYIEPEDEWDELDECGLMHDGQCTQAGTEHCDFVCPMRDSEFFAGSKAWRKKHGEPEEANK